MSDFYPFWVGDKKPAIDNGLLLAWLEDEGFGNYTPSNDRREDGEIIHINNKIIQPHSPNSVKRFIVNTVENDETLEARERVLVKGKVAAKTEGSIKTLCNSLPNYVEEDSPQEGQQISIVKDRNGICYLPFKNGVVIITKDNITVVPIKDLQEQGCFWEKSLIPHDFELLDENTEASKIEKFIDFGFARNVVPIHPDDGETDLTPAKKDKKYQQQRNAFELAYGYLIHSYNPPDDLKAVVFVDGDSRKEGEANGRTGKSLTMGTLGFFKNTLPLSGETFQKSSESSGRFNFDTVKVDTKLVIVNELNPRFDIKDIFSVITDDMYIEVKRETKFRIPKGKKPKIAFTTNYVVAGTGASYEGRQHVVEFGNFWNKVHQKGWSPKDFLGGLLADEDNRDAYDKDEWTRFFNFGVRCVQKYLQQGLVSENSDDYKLKQITQKIEGFDGDGSVTEWITNWVENTRIEKEYDIKGITEDDFYQEFLDENPNHSFSQNKLSEGIFTYATMHEKYDYNADKAAKGNTRTNRRLRMGPAGNQKNGFRITNVHNT